MRFNPNYVTKDDWFEVMLDIKTLTPEKAKPTGYCQSDEITIHKIIVYNTKTQRMSEKSIYYNEEKGFYFKGNTKYWNSSPYSKYYINELKEITNYER